MLDNASLRDILKIIYGVEDKYLVPISTNWFVPTIDPEDKIGTWIGYRIISKRPYTRAYQKFKTMVIPTKVSFRMTFVGPEAEKLCDQTLAWDVRTDVIRAFEKYQAQINYVDRNAFTYPTRNAGFNDCMSWIVDMSAQTFYEIDTKQEPWVVPR